MARKTIDETPTYRTDGSGDSLEKAFAKCNSNFSEVFASMSRAPKVRSAPETVTTIDNCEVTTGWTATNGSVALNATNKFRGDNSIRLTATSGATAYMLKAFTNPVPAIGKTFRVWVNIPDLTKVVQVQFLVWLGSTGSSNYYTFQFTKASGRIVEGEQIFEYNVGYNSTSRTVVGSPDLSQGITQVRCYVQSESGQVGIADFDAIEFVQRRPKLLFINDSPYREFVDPIVPLLDERSIPYTVQLTKGLLSDWQSTGVSSGNASLAEYRAMLKRGAVSGIHFDARSAVTDETYYTDSRAQLATAYSLGLLESGFMASALQGAWTNTTRLDWACSIAGMARRGDAITEAGILGTSIPGALIPHHGFIPSSPMFSHRDVPSLEFGQDLETSDIDTYFTDAIANENLFTIFGHGVETTPGQLFRSPQSIYDYFFDALDSVSEKFDFVTPASLLDASIRDPRYKIGLFSYRPSGLK